MFLHRGGKSEHLVIGNSDEQGEPLTTARHSLPLADKPRESATETIQTRCFTESNVKSEMMSQGFVSPCMVTCMRGKPSPVQEQAPI